MLSGSLGIALRDLRRAARWHRRLLAAGLAAGAMALALSALSPPPPPSVLVVVAARDLAGGSVLTDRDLGTRRLPRDAVPAQAMTAANAAVGRIVASATRAGEPLTDVRLLGPSLLTALGAGQVAAPVRVADAAAVRLLRAGDVVDVVAAATSSSAAGTGGAPTARAVASVVAPAARVLLGASPIEGGAGGDGALLVLAVDGRTALSLARAAMYARLSVLLRPP